MKSFQTALQRRTSVLKELNERRKHYSHTRNVGLNVGLKINLDSLFGNDFDTSAQHKNKSSPLSNTRDRIGSGAPLYQPNNSQIVPSSCMISAAKSPGKFIIILALNYILEDGKCQGDMLTAILISRRTTVLKSYQKNLYCLQNIMYLLVSGKKIELFLFEKVVLFFAERAPQFIFYKKTF